MTKRDVSDNLKRDGGRCKTVVKKSIYSGCRIVATAHGDDRQEWFLRGGKEARVADIPFERYVFLKADGPPGQIEEICDNTGKTIGLRSGGAIC